MYPTSGGRGDDSVYVSSVVTHKLRSENIRGQVFSDNKPYVLLLSVHFGAMAKRLFLPTNRNLILEFLRIFIATGKMKDTEQMVSLLRV
jgi:hypothetical protein